MSFILPPSWVMRLIQSRGAVIHRAPFDATLSIAVAQGPDFTLLTARARNATHLSAAEFERSAAAAYAALAEHVAARPGRHVVRFWNHIPDIRRTDERGLDRYMVFNAGRFAACSRWFGSPETFGRLLPTASAVGHDGEDLVVHALAGADPGVAVENPRQVPSYRYSERFGPRPPCFARATVLKQNNNGEALVLVAGTASIRGEQTVHPGDVAAQLRETFENLSVLVETAGASGPPSPLARFRDLRVYYVRKSDLPVIAKMVAAALPHLRDVEYVRADLCRPDLLVEIEGTAVLPAPR